VGDGWFGIIDSLCAELSIQVKAGKIPPVVALQVKQKSGYLRFYIRGHFNRDANQEAHRLIGLAQQKAEHLEQCGQPAPLRALDYGDIHSPACAAEPLKDGGAMDEGPDPNKVSFARWFVLPDSIRDPRLFAWRGQIRGHGLRIKSAMTAGLGILSRKLPVASTQTTAPEASA
jgi:hypothetical protein